VTRACSELPRFQAQDVVIQNRCAKDVWFWHGEYGPVAFSLYHTLPADTRGALRARLRRAACSAWLSARLAAQGASTSWA
jgi:hypothetical protein